MSKQPPLKIKKDSGLAVLTFNRPDVYNALDTETVNLALSAVQELQSDPEIRAIVLTGAGKAFVAGADIAEMRQKTPAEARIYSELGQKLMRTIEQMNKPTIAAINGYCLGGGMEVALASDIRIASDKARFGLPETILGIIPGWGALPRVTRLVGAAVTKELVFTGDLIDARRALEIGLINQLVMHDELMNRTMEIARKTCRQSRFAISRAKEVINASFDITLADACTMETDAFVACFESGDYKEGMQAFLEKREPDFDSPF
jgi:enoyl-CoA hydratase